MTDEDKIKNLFEIVKMQQEINNNLMEMIRILNKRVDTVETNIIYMFGDN